MSFSETLNEYIDAADCTLGDLSRESGITASTISRYRNGSRVPDPNAGQIPAIAEALARLTATSGAPLDETEVARELTAAAGGGPEVENACRLLDALGVNNSNLARSVSFDASYISRVRNGKSHPADAEAFAQGVLHYIANHCVSADEKSAVASLIGADVSQLADSHAYLKAMQVWAGVVHNEQADPAEDFLSKLDAFDLDDYLRAVRFDEIKLPPTMPHIPMARTYRGLAELRQGELDFFRALVTSRNASTLFMCIDMPMNDMAEDLDFGKKWMFGVAATLKRGIHLNVIHNVNRSFREMMLGLESWIPLYMTGQVSPFYLSGNRDEHYMHALYAAETVMLLGEGIAGHHDAARYYVSRRKDDIAYGIARAQHLLERARPLMDIYRMENAGAYRVLVEKERQDKSPRRRMLPAPPIFTLSDSLFDGMIARAKISADDAERIRRFISEERADIESFLANGGTLADTVADFGADEFAQRPARLAFSDIFLPVRLQYTFEEYRAHVEASERFARDHEGYAFATDPNLPFRNIRITINEGQAVIISKGGSPCIHFAIRHPQLRSALENMVVAVAE